MTDVRPTPEREHALTESVFRKLQSDDPATWRALFAAMLPIAKDKIRHRFQVGTIDELDAEAALWSACTSFHRHFVEGKLGNLESLEDLAVLLLRIAHNRWQRKRYREKKWIHEVSSANVQSRGGEWMPFDPCDPATFPGREVIEREFPAYLDEVIHQILEDEQITANPRKLQALAAYVANPCRRQADIAELVGIQAQSTVSRWIDNFNERIKSMVAEQDEA